MSDSYTEIKYTAPPQSRNEAILAATVDGTQYTDPPQSRIEDLLVQVKEKIEQGGGGGTSDYTDLANKPQINGVTLTENMSSADLGLQAEITANNKLSSDLVDDANATNQFVTSSEKSTWNGKQNALSFDPTPTDGSTNPVESNGIYDALAGKADKSTTYTKNDIDFLLTKKQGTLTSAQLAAANSGITADKVGQYDDIYAVMNYNALNHNGIFRGKDLTNVYTIDEMYSMIHAGTFDDLFLGDYFTKSITTDIMTRFTGAEFESGTTYYEMGGEDPTTRTWTETEDTTPQSGKTYATKETKTENITLMFAAFDYYYNMGDPALATHHAMLIPRGAGFATTAKMNSTNTTEGGYYGSDMHQITLPCYAKSLKTMLENHLLSHATWLTTTVNTSTPSMAGAGMTGAASASAWKTAELQLMNEVQLYGSTIWSSSAYDVGIDNEKLPSFNFINPVSFARANFWLRSVVSSLNFANCSYQGNAIVNAASNAYSVRPLILFG